MAKKTMTPSERNKALAAELRALGLAPNGDAWTIAKQTLGASSEFKKAAAYAASKNPGDWPRWSGATARHNRPAVRVPAKGKKTTSKKAEATPSHPLASVASAVAKATAFRITGGAKTPGYVKAYAGAMKTAFAASEGLAGSDFVHVFEKAFEESFKERTKAAA